MRAEDIRHQVPPADAFGQTNYQRRNPYIYTAGEIVSLLSAAAQLGPCGSFRPRMYPVLFGLIAATGIRISEALALKVSDIAEDGLVIRQSKFRKSRLVLLHSTTQEALRAYLSARAALTTSDDALFVSDSRKVLAISAAEYTFRTLVRSIGLTGAPDRSNPHIHDLRHNAERRVIPTRRKKATGRRGSCLREVERRSA
jgi:integrase